MRESARRWLAGAAVLGIATLVSGCNSSSLSKRELVVYFAPGAPQAEHAAAWGACEHATPAATAEPLPPASELPSNSVGDVRFRIDHTDDGQLAVLERCLNKQPGVRGVDIPDLTD
jgi:hypothetical protein